MFCPKCKYTTFDFYEFCPKCNFNWNHIRKELGIDWIMESDVIEVVSKVESDEVEVKIQDTQHTKKEEEIETETSKDRDKIEEQKDISLDISSPEEEEEIEVELDSSLFIDNTKENKGAAEEDIPSTKDNLETEIEIEMDVEQERGDIVELSPIEQDKKEEQKNDVVKNEVWDIEFDGLIVEKEKDPGKQKNTQSPDNDLDIEILLDDEKGSNK